MLQCPYDVTRLWCGATAIQITETYYLTEYINGLVQERHHSIANALELHDQHYHYHYLIPPYCMLKMYSYDDSHFVRLIKATVPPQLILFMLHLFQET